MTPLQVIRNVIEIAGGPQAGRPTPLLEKYVRLNAAAQLTQANRPAQPTTPPPSVVNTTAAQPPEPQGDERYMPKALAK